MQFEHILPSDIEKESFRIINKELAMMGKSIPAELEPTVLRVIHTTADFDYADTLVFSDGAIGKAKDAIRRGAHIVTDTNMALSGSAKRRWQNMAGRPTALWQMKRWRAKRRAGR